jgi:hypothetical protein
MSEEDRKSYQNGIWMCRHHGTLIDLDETRFTMPLLQQWRAAAERRAEMRQAHQHLEQGNHDLFRHDVRLVTANLAEATIGHAFVDAGIPVFWGPDVAAAVRDFVFEIAQNALTHGAASHFDVEITPKYIRLTDDGAAFDPKTLQHLPNPRGGALAMQALRTALGDRLILSIKPGERANEYTLQYLRTQSDLVSSTPCCVSKEHEMPDGSTIRKLATDRIAGCDVIYVIVPDYTSYSRAAGYKDDMSQSFPDKQVVFVGGSISSGVRDLMTQIPGSRFLALAEPQDPYSHYFYDDA